VNLKIVKRPGMVKDSSQYEYDLSFDNGIGQRPLETFRVMGDASLHAVLVNHLDQPAGDVAHILSGLQGPNSRVEVISDVHVQGCALQPEEVRLMIRGIEAECRQAK
jgi:hypothetical protein